MEVQGIRGHGSPLAAEKYEMLDLNKRLETYLGRVKFLEEENGQLRGEVENLRKRRHSTAWKKELEARLRKARDGVEAARRERDRVELDVGNLSDELQTLELRRQREAAAKAEARKWLAESKKELEEEQRGQIWLREKLSQLEKELQFHKEVHREEVSALHIRVTQTPPNIVPAPVHHQVLSLQDLSQDYSQRAARAWREAASGYQDQVIQLEDALAQAKSHMVQATQDKKECQLKAQSLARELEVACGTKEVLEKRVAQQKEGHLMELKHLQEYLESLEGEKAALGHQISVILEDRCNLVQIKMSLGLEVATYRALLDSESLRRPTNPRSSCSVGERPDSQSAKQNHQTVFTRCHNIRTVSNKHGARAQNQAATMAMMPLQTPRQITPTETSRRSWSSKEQQFGWSVESSRPAGVSTSYPKGFGNRMGSIEYSEAKEALNEEITQDEAPSMLKSAAAVPLAINQLTRGGISRTEPKEEQNMHAPEPESSLTSNDPTAEQEPIPDFNITGQSELPSEIEKISCQNDPVPVDFPQLNNPDTLTTAGQQCPLKNRGENELDVPSEINTENVLLRAPLFAWGESQVVTDMDEIDHVERKASETKTEPGSGPEVDIDETDSFDCGTAASESELPLSVIKVNLLSEVLNHTERTEEKTNESVGSTASTDDADSSSIGIESEKLLENITVPGDDTTDIFNGKNGYEANQDSTEEIGVQTSDSETELSETEEEGKVIASKEKSDFDGETEKDVIFVNENVPILESSAEVKPRGEQQEQTSSDTEQLDSFDDDKKESSSWRTFGGEPESYDSYAQDNTLADTSPLIRYKSDEVDTQASYLDEVDSSENDDEGESGTGLWEQEKTSSLSSKGTAMMEALTEKSQSETMKEEGKEKPVKEEEVEPDEEMEKSSLGNDETDVHERDMNCLGDGTTDDGSPTVPEIYLEENSGDKTNGYMDVEEKGCSESCDFTAVLKEETIESESSLEPDARSHDNAGEETMQVNPANTYRVWSSEIKPHTEQLDSSDDDEKDSPNASQSWRTFGGEPESYDSYAQDNTLADTSPLIRYKSDEVDTQASYLDEVDSSENDDEGESGTGLWEQEKRSSLSSKGTAMMEALTEKSQSETMKEEGKEKPVKEEEVEPDEEMEKSSLGNDETDGHERDMNCLGDGTTDDGGPTVPEIYLEENSGDKTNGYMDVEEKGCSESCDFTAVLKEETIESESSLEPDARSHDNAGEETMQVNPANTYLVWSSEIKPHTEQLDSSDDDEKDSLNVDMMDALTEESERETIKGEGRGEPLKDEEMGASQVSENINLRNDETNTYRVCSEIKPHSEEEVKMDSDLENFTVSASSPSRVLAESYEVSSSENVDKITCEMFLEQTVAPDDESEGPVQSEKTEIPADGNIEDEKNLSMLTNMDYTDDLSLQNEFSTGLLSQTNMGNFDDSFSSEDESPNASQFSQPLNQEGNFLENEDMTNTRKLFGTMGETKEHSSEAFSTLEENAIENVVGSSTEKDFSQQDQLEALENPKVEPQAQLFQNSQNLSELSQEISNSEDKKDEELVAEEQLIFASQPSEDFTNSTRNKADIFMVDETEELPQTNGKNMDLHNMFSSTLDDNFRNSAKATETGEDLPECELSNQTTMQPNQNLAYGVAWGDAQNLLGGNEYTMEAWKANKVPAQQEKGPMPVQIKKHLCRDMDEDKIHSEDSLEEGNSWSSGED